MAMSICRPSANSPPSISRRPITEILFRHFEDAEKTLRARLLARQPQLALPAYDQCMKASHIFNLLDARGVISVTERQAYIGRVRTLAKGCCEAWLAGMPAARGG